MKSFVRRWPFWVEFGLVMAVAFGPFIVSAWQEMPHGHQAKVRFDDMVLVGTVFTEAALGLGLVVFLKMRGYSRADFPFRMALPEWGLGLRMLAWAFIAVTATASLAVSFLGQHIFDAGMMKATVSVSLPVAVIGSFVNALYEELFVTAYMLRTLEKPHGIETAVLASVFVRFLYHVYQGPQAIFTVIPIGIVFAVYYVRTRNLWPLVLAHALIDIAAFCLGTN